MLVVSLCFNPQSVNISYRILPQMIRVEMKHLTGPADSPAGHLAGSLAGHGASISGWHGKQGVPWQPVGPVRAVSQQPEWLSRVPVSCQPPGPGRAAVRGPLAPWRPPGSPRVSPAPSPGRNPRPSGLWVPQHSPARLPKRRCRKDDSPLRRGTLTGRLLLFS